MFQPLGAAYSGGRMPELGGGWVRIGDALPDAGVISDKVFQDPPVNSVLLSCTTSDATFYVRVYSSFPIVTVDGVPASLSLAASGGYYEGDVLITISGSKQVLAQATSPDGEPGADDAIAVTLDAPPELLTLSFTGGYPGSQTELKEGDTFQISGTTDKPCVGVRILDYEACQLDEPTFPSDTSFVVTGTIADRGDTSVARPARVQAKNAVGAYGSTRDTDELGGTTDGVDLVYCNNLHPTATIGLITYPGVQEALKDSETATVVMTLSNLDTVLFDSPNSQLSITNPTTIETPKTVQRIAGDYNVTTNNFRCTANRAANDADTISQVVVQIAHVACTIQVVEPAARLRSGGNDGTSIQNHTITIQADQELLSAPSLSEESGGGTFIGSWVGGPEDWTRTLQVHDDDVKGTYSWQSPSATNLAGRVTSAITGDGNYVLGGFVQRDLTFPAFSQTTVMNVEVITYTKLQAGIFTATNQPAVRHTPQGDHADADDEFTVDSIATNPTDLWWNDVDAAATNSTGTAQITDVEEVV